MKAIILAAGYATRLYPLTQNMPKALLPIAGKTMLDRLMEKFLDCPRLSEIHIVTNEKFFAQFSEWAENAKTVYPMLSFTVWNDHTTSNENRLGAIGDIQFVLKQQPWNDDLLVAASDNLMDLPLKGFFADFAQNHLDMVLTGRMADLEECKRFAVVETNESGIITHLVEKPEQPRANLVAYASYLYRKDTVSLFETYLKEGNNPDSPGHFPEWLYKRKPMRAYEYEGRCIDIGTVESYRETCESWKDE